MKQRFARLMKESFIPIVIILLGLVVLLVYAEFESSSIANQVVIIDIDGNQSNIDDNEDAGDFDDSDSGNLVEPGQDPRIEQAKAFSDNQEWKQAEALYQSLIKDAPTSRNYAEFSAYFIRRNQLEQAQTWIDKAIKTQPVHANAYAYRGLINAKNGNKIAAMSDYQQALKMIPLHFQANNNLGVIYYRDKDYPQAAKSFKNAASAGAGQSKAKALYNLALSYKHMDKKKLFAAKKALEKAIRLRPDYTQARFALAGLQDDTPDGRQAALDQLGTLLRLHPNYTPALFRKAVIYKAAGDRKQAYANYHAALKINPNYTKAHNNLGLLYAEDKKWQLATAEFERMIELEPNNPIGYFQLGKTAYAHKNYPEAIKHFEKALQIRNGKYDKALLSIGLSYAKLNQYDKAIEYYRKAIELDKNYATAWYNLGIALAKSEKFDQAEQAYLTALKIKTDYAPTWFSLGALYGRMNQNDKAIDAYVKAISFRPNYRKAQLNLAVRLTFKGQYHRAISLYQEVLKKDPSYAMAWINLGALHYDLNNLDEAEKELHNGMELEPENITALKYMALIQAKKGEYSQAIELLNQATAQQLSDVELRLELAKVYAQSGDKKRAKIEVNKALKLAPNYPEAIKFAKTLSAQ